MKKVLILLALFVCGCGGTTGLPPSAECESLIEALANRITTCTGGDLSSTRAALNSALDHGLGCAACVDIKDRTSFDEFCIPAIEASTCSDLTGPLPAACSGQLIF